MLISELRRLIFGMVMDLFRSRAALEAEIMVVCTENHIRVYQVTESAKLAQW